MTDSSTASDAGSETDQTRELPFDSAVVDRVAGAEGVETSDLTDALAVLDAELLGKHSEFESEYDYVTADGRRAYLVDEAAWESFADSFDFENDLRSAARHAHDEQARLLYDSLVESAELVENAVGVVVGVDTAEEML
ncbi:hypothetical protein [Haloprofundus salilacus]|uniref:hypothetical protein n=1 Tax=Haloprofundus salilacus TaxID=2876190 RepID=UPI001CCD250E|nr:hypothetical protein [Haloprofundus salilacus]